MEILKKVLITGIGGNVAQGIIRNINFDYPDIFIIGINIDDFSSGNHLCDKFYRVPYANEDNYLEVIRNIVFEENVDLIIPSTDDEAYQLSKVKNRFPCDIAVSDVIATSIFLDKMNTYYHCKKHDIPFAVSCRPEEYKREFSELIVKPREGRGSRGIVVNPEYPESFSDDYMVQEFHRGVEVTVAFYVTKLRKLNGFVVQERTLESGTTKSIKISKKYDNLIKPIIEKLIVKTPIYGSANLQAIITRDSKVIPFEINCRISGTNSMRSQFGFKDVKYTIEEWLYNQIPSTPIIREGIATRIIMDVIFEENTDFTQVIDKTSRHYIF